MTTRWTPTDIWKGKTVAVLGSGPSMSQELADSVKHLPRICARRSARFALDADMLVALDGPADERSWKDSEYFEGLRIVGFENPDIDAMYLAIPHERVRLSETHEVEIRNNGLVAIRIAAMSGASKILLLGFDRGMYGVNAPEGMMGFVGLEEGLEALITELRSKGIEVERVDSGQAGQDIRTTNSNTADGAASGYIGPSAEFSAAGLAPRGRKKK